MKNVNFVAPEGSEPRPKNFGQEHTPFEKDLQKFSKEIREHQAENKIENIRESHVKEVLTSRFGQPTVPSRGGTQTQTSVLNEKEILPDYLIAEPAQIKNEVERLIDTAFSEGIEKSVKEARKQGPFILDAFHDALTAKLYEELKKRGLLK